MYPEIHIYSFVIESYTLLYIIAFIVVTLLLKYELKRNNYPPYFYILLTVVSLTSGLIGSKIYYLLEIWNEFIQNPYGNFFHIGGSGWYGGFALGCISIWLTLKIKKLPVLKTLDIMAPIIPLGQVIGRLGCFLAGCCHGIPSHVSWAVSFPDGLFPPSVKVHPTQLYEMVVYLFIFILLWNLRKKAAKNGVKFSLYLILSGLGRFMVEFYRLNPKTPLGLTVPQIIAIIGIMLGVYIIVRKTKIINEMKHMTA